MGWSSMSDNPRGVAFKKTGLSFAPCSICIRSSLPWSKFETTFGSFFLYLTSISRLINSANILCGNESSALSTDRGDRIVNVVLQLHEFAWDTYGLRSSSFHPFQNSHVTSTTNAPTSSGCL